MPTRIGDGQKSLHWHGTERTNAAESIGTLWLIFYMFGPRSRDFIALDFARD